MIQVSCGKLLDIVSGLVTQTRAAKITRWEKKRSEPQSSDTVSLRVYWEEVKAQITHVFLLEEEVKHSALIWPLKEMIRIRLFMCLSKGREYSIGGRLASTVRWCKNLGLLRELNLCFLWNLAFTDLSLAKPDQISDEWGLLPPLGHVGLYLIQMNKQSH